MAEHVPSDPAESGSLTCPKERMFALSLHDDSTICLAEGKVPSKVPVTFERREQVIPQLDLPLLAALRRRDLAVRQVSPIKA